MALRLSSCKRANDNFRLLPGSVLDSQFLPHFARGRQPAVDLQAASCPKDISLGWQTTARCLKKKDRFLFCSQNSRSWHSALKRGKQGTLIEGSSAPRAAGTRGRRAWSKYLRQLSLRYWFTVLRSRGATVPFALSKMALA